MTPRVRANLAGAARVIVNVGLAHASAATAMTAGLLIQYGPDAPELPLGLVGTVIYGMWWLAWGAPLVLLVLTVLDVTVAHGRSGRRNMVIAALVPGLLYFAMAARQSELVPSALWLIATGLLFGGIARLPKERADAPPSTVSGS
jgi:hypothetical protein